MAADPTPPPDSRLPTPDSELPLDAPAIEARAAEMWQKAAEGVGGLARTCSQTVLVMALEAPVVERVDEVLAQAPLLHPCRMIVLTRGQSEPRAQATAFCRPPNNGRGIVCWEEIRLEGSPTSLDRVMSAARSLVMPNLPVQVWWPDEPDVASDLFEQTIEIGDRLIVDSARFADPLRTLAAYADRAEQNHAVGFADLNWRRIEPWRLLVAQLFDPPDDRRLLDYVETVVVRFGRSAGRSEGLAEALLLVGWLASRLAWTPPTAPLGGRDVEHALFDDGGRLVRVELRRATGAQPADGLLAVELHAAVDEYAATYTARRSGDRATWVAEINGARREASAPLGIPGDVALLERELAGFGRDRIYEESLQVVRALARGTAVGVR